MVSFEKYKSDKCRLPPFIIKPICSNFFEFLIFFFLLRIFYEASAIRVFVPAVTLPVLAPLEIINCLSLITTISYVYQLLVARA